jgi:hypothetical protein
MNGSEIPELCGFIENEINYGFTLVQSVRLASSKDCNLQAINSAVTAYETARRSVAHVSLAKRNPRWESRQVLFAPLVGRSTTALAARRAVRLL